MNIITNHDKTSYFLALDIKNTISTCLDKDASSNSSPKFIKSSTRKGSQRTSGGAEIALVIESEAVDNVHVEGKDKSDNLLFGTSTPTVNGRHRQRSVSKRLLSRWLDPRRVLFFFATLSSMGTLLLLYLTLSMGKISIGNAQT